MRSERYDVIVLGVGGMGSAACYHLAKRGVRVLGLERFEIGHARGSSHGETRLIRRAYFENPAYVPLLERSYVLWDELMAESGEKLLHRTGLIIYGPETKGGTVDGVRQSARLHGIPIEDGRGATPAFVPPPGTVGVFEPGAGYLEVEKCVVAHAARAKAHGATIMESVEVTARHETADGVTVTTSAGTFAADRLIITAGPWAASFLPRVAPRLSVHRVPLFWFPAKPGFTEEAGAPCFGFELPRGFFYGLPGIAGGPAKIGLHIPGERVEGPLMVDRGLREDELSELQAFVRAHLPQVEATLAKHVVCMYTMTPDEHFVIDREGRVSYACGFSGHGFKFASVVGEILAQLTLDGRTDHPIDFLRYRWA